MFIDFDASRTDNGEAKQLSAMVSASENFCRLMHANAAPRWLSLLGTSGAGKTMLAERIIRWARKWRADDLDPRNLEGETFRIKVSSFKWSRCIERMLEGDFDWTQRAKSDFIVLLDDIGTESDSPKVKAMAISKLYAILEARRGLWTIVTANLSVEEIGTKMDPRISSRLFRDESEVIDVDVEDYNILQFKARKGRK